MKYKQCPKCWTTFNPNESGSICPACNFQTEKKKKEKIDKEIYEYIGEMRKEAKREVASYRKNEVLKWEREHGKQVYE